MAVGTNAFVLTKNRLEDYLYYCLSNIVFITILVCLILQNLEQSKRNININEVMLFIPKNQFRI